MAEKSQTKAAAAMADDKKRAIETAMQQIERTYGKGSIMRFGDNTVSNVEAISTGSLALDLALGIGGLPKGRIIEIYGPESSGKTTLALHVLAQAQKAGGEVGVHRRRARARHRPMPARLASRSRICSSPSRTPASRRLRSPRRSCAPARSTSSWSTPSRRSCRARRSRARWATALSVCTRASCRRRCAS